MATLPDMLRAEMYRCQTLARDYATLGSTGAFARALLDEAVLAAEHALRHGDVAVIQHALDRLRTFREVMPDTPPRMAVRPAAGLARDAAAIAPAQPRTILQEQFFTWTRRA